MAFCHPLKHVLLTPLIYLLLGFTDFWGANAISKFLVKKKKMKMLPFISVAVLQMH